MIVPTIGSSVAWVINEHAYYNLMLLIVHLCKEVLELALAKEDSQETVLIYLYPPKNSA